MFKRLLFLISFVLVLVLSTNVSGALVGHWEFDGDLTSVGGVGQAGVAHGNIGFENDPWRGLVLSLPGGSNQFVDLGSVGISGNMPRTIACWAKADNTNIPDWTLIFGFTGTADGSGGNGSHFNIGSLGGPGGVGAHCWGWEETIFSDEEALEWHHYAMTYDGTTIQYYGDGAPMDTDAGKSNVRDLAISADRVYVGSRITQSSSFPGKVDDARIYDTALTAAEIVDVMGPGFPFAKDPIPADGEIDADVTALEWTAGATAANQKVYLSTDATIDDADLLTETGPGLSIAVATLDPGATYYWRVDEVEAGGKVWEGDVWTFSTLPKEAHFPSPGDGDRNIVTITLSWTPGKNAIMHNVHFGKDPAMLLPVQTMSMNTSYDPGPLERVGVTYYWRVDEFTPTGTVTGPVWSFSTLPATEPPIADPNLVGYWPCDDGDGSHAVLDSSGHGNHGIFNGTINWVAGAVDGAIEFLGDDQGWVELPGDMPITAAKGSIFMWINTTQNDDEGMLLYAGPTGGDGYGGENELHLNIDDGGTGQLDFFIEDPGGDRTVDYDNIGGTGWRHVGATWDVDGGIHLYVDGFLVDSASHNGATYGFQTIRLGRPIGTGNGNRFYDGMMDDVMLYDYAFGEEQVRQTFADTTIPYKPSPTDGASNLPSATALSWSPGDGAVEQDVYLGLDEAAVADANSSDTTGIYLGRQAETTYTPVLTSGEQYYWRVDQVAADGSTVAGPVWSFSVARMVPAAANLGACPTDVPGFLIRSLKAQSQINNFNEMNEILETGLLDGQPPEAGSEGTRIDEFVNMRDTGNGAFDNDKSFPGIDPLEVPAADPAAGDDDNDFATEILGCIQLTAGIHRIGANSDDGTIVWIGGVEVVRTGELKGASNVDRTFEVEADGYYSLRARTFERGGGASIELHEILPDGTRILLNDVANGGSAVFAPAQ